jgi:hypothetical protein
MLVEWKESALDQLADIYVAANLADRDRIEATVERINAQLADDPSDLGESRSGRLRRVWFNHPLVVKFRFDPDRGLVIVSEVVRLRG